MGTGENQKSPYHPNLFELRFPFTFVKIRV